MLRAALLLLVLLLPAGPALGQCLDYADYEHWAGRTTLADDPWGTCLVGPDVCVTVGPGGIQIVDPAGPSGPVVIGTMDTPGRAWGVDAAGSHLLVADGATGLLVVDASDPADPVIVNTVPVGTVYTVKVDGTRAYTAGNGTVHVLDISDILTPAILGSLSIGSSSYDLDVSGSLVYVAALDGLHVIDVAVPSTPSQIGFLAAGTSYLYSIDVEGDHAYVIKPFYNEYGYLLVIDVSDPTTPSTVGSESFFSGALDVLVDGTTAYIAAASYVLKYDVGTPSEPVYLGTLLATGYGYRLSRDTTRIYVPVVGYDFSTLEVVDVSGPVPAVVTTTPSAAAFDICVIGNHAYSAGRYGFGYMEVMDVSNPRAPTVLANRSVQNAERIAVTGATACITRINALTLVDVGTPASPVVRGTISSIGTVYDVDASGSHAYAAVGAGIAVVNIANPLVPVHVQTINTGMTQRVTISNGLLYVLSPAGVTTYGLADPAAPAFIHHNPVTGNDLAVVGTRLYLAAVDLTVFDVSNPQAPLKLGSAVAPSPVGGIAVDGNYAYVGDGFEGVAVYDVSDPAQPVYHGSHRGAEISSWDGGGLAVVGDVLYACSGWVGIHVIDLQCPATSAVPAPPPATTPLALGTPYPNPFRESVRFTFDAPSGSPLVSAAVFSVSGRLVRHIDLRAPAGSGIATWDGRNDAGVDVPPGAYFLRLDNGTDVRSRRIIRLR